MSAGSNKLKIEDVRKHIEDSNCKLISKKYVSFEDKLKIKFSCGHTKLMSFDCFKRGQRCSCDRIKRFKNSVELKTRKMKEIIGKAEKLNFLFLFNQNFLNGKKNL